MKILSGISGKESQYRKMVKDKKITSCVTKETTIAAFFEDFKKDVSKLAYHLFTAEWQQEQFKCCIDNMGDDEAVLSMDFAEDYACHYQNEVQAGYFDKTKVTLHPMHANYYQIVDGCKTLVKHSIIGVSDHCKKDNVLVKKFEDAAINIVEKNKESKVDTVHEFTDGCSSQYKGRNTFYDISQRSKPQIVRNFYETSHGKPVCDGLGAITKNYCYRAVVTGKAIISSAEDMFDFCKNTLTIADKKILDKNKTEYVSRREFVIISSDECSSVPQTELKTLPGTRKLHSVKSTKENMKLLSRDLTCYCHSTPCKNREYVSKWKTEQLQYTGNMSIL